MKRILFSKGVIRNGLLVSLLVGLSTVSGQEQSAADDSSETTESEVAPSEAPVPESEGGESAPGENSTEDSDVLREAPGMEVEQLEEMIQVYQRLSKGEMVKALSTILLECG